MLLNKIAQRVHPLLSKFLPQSLALLVLVSCSMRAAESVRVTIAPDGLASIENGFLRRALSAQKGGSLKTKAIFNTLANASVEPTACSEFEIRISQGTHKPGTAVRLTAADFQIETVREYELKGVKDGKGLCVDLQNAPHGLSVQVKYELAPTDFYLRKYLVITSNKAVTLERIDVDCLACPNVIQPYTVRAITTHGKWSPGLGQPLYGTTSGTFWGIEFPAADNFVKESVLHAGYLWGREIAPGVPYKSYASVLGVADDPNSVSDAFMKYIDQIRIRPLRLQVQYNTWFDYGGGIQQKTFADSVAIIHQKLVKERANRPLQAYVIDDGWQDSGANWCDKVWKVNSKFDANFSTSIESVKAGNSTLGLWLSPGCLFGGQRAVGNLRKGGFEALDSWMSLAGPKYGQLLEDRMVELTKQGVTYFKLDGIFGHLNTREFELHGDKYGIPFMPQLIADGMKANDPRLNDVKYDELKIYYLTAGTERLMKTFKNMAAANPDVYIVISNGAYLSPWWLMYIDSVWMINAGDAAEGGNRTQELVYRDDRYYEIWPKEQTQFPMNSIFNHEPKKLNSTESKEVFRKYLYMSLSRGTGFVELYIKPKALKDYDWDVISEGLHWAYAVFPTFKRSRMHGGSPKNGEVYGYTGWTDQDGYLSIHNPSAKPQKYSVVLNRKLGLTPNAGPYLLSSPIVECMEGLKSSYAFGDTLELELKPREIRVLNFSTKERDWSELRKLQTRTEGPVEVKPVPIEKHPVLGIWKYESGGSSYTREFTRTGECILKGNGQPIWEKPFTVVDDKTVLVEGSLKHVLKDNDTLLIEGRYQASKQK